VSSRLLGGLGFLGLLWCATVNSDGRKASLGNAQRPRPGVIVTAPRRQRRRGRDFFDQAITQQLADHFAGCPALEIRRKDDGPVLPLRGGGQQHELGIGECHGIIPRSVCDGVARRHHRSPAVGVKPAGQDPGARHALYKAPTVTLCLQRKSSPLCEKIWLCRLFSPL
jgi:hypothetical protein